MEIMQFIMYISTCFLTSEIDSYFYFSKAYTFCPVVSKSSDQQTAKSHVFLLSVLTGEATQ